MTSSDNLGHFTADAQLAMTLAGLEAERFAHDYIGTEHLLLGVLAFDSSASRALRQYAQRWSRPELSTEGIRDAVEFIVGRAEGVGDPAHGLTPRTQTIIRLAVQEAREQGRRQVDAGHLLLAILREGEGVGAGVLESLGVQLDLLRHEVLLQLEFPGEG